MDGALVLHYALTNLAIIGYMARLNVATGNLIRKCARPIGLAFCLDLGLTVRPVCITSVGVYVSSAYFRHGRKLCK